MNRYKMRRSLSSKSSKSFKVALFDFDLNQTVGEQGWLDLDNPSTLLSCFLEGSPKESHNPVHCRMTLPNPPAPSRSDQSNTPISQWGGEAAS